MVEQHTVDHRGQEEVVGLAMGDLVAEPWARRVDKKIKEEVLCASRYEN